MSEKIYFNKSKINHIVFLRNISGKIEIIIDNLAP